MPQYMHVRRNEMQKMKAAILLPTVGFALMLSGCVNNPPPSTQVQPLAQPSAAFNLAKYQSATVVPFETAAQVKDTSVGETFAKDLVWRLKNNYGAIFSSVTYGSPAGRPDELIITGRFDKYEPGSRAARELIGLGSASLDGSVILQDGGDRHSIYQGEFNKWWGWGGLSGGTGIEDLEAVSAIAVANTIAIAKGWTPPPKRGNEHPKYAEYRASLAPVESSRARLWFYRPNHRNAWNETLQIRVDGAYVGTAENGGFFSVDVEPGTHQVSQALLPKIETVSVDAQAGNEVFIMTLASHGFSLTFPKPELVPNTQALNEIEHLELRGN
ncbi:MAG: DUF2846 domain-containing protein [Limisphaerales bacterium]